MRHVARHTRLQDRIRSYRFPIHGVILITPLQPSWDLTVVAVIIGIHVPGRTGSGQLIDTAAAPVFEIKFRPGIYVRTHIVIWVV